MICIYFLGCPQFTPFILQLLTLVVYFSVWHCYILLLVFAILLCTSLQFCLHIHIDCFILFLSFHIYVYEVWHSCKIPRNNVPQNEGISRSNKHVFYHKQTSAKASLHFGTPCSQWNRDPRLSTLCIRASTTFIFISVVLGCRTLWTFSEML